MQLRIEERATGEVIASGVEENSVQIFEGNWYFAPEVVNTAHLRVSSRTYTCPYKGVCYWIDLDSPHQQVQNIGWVYFDTKPGYDWIKGLYAFYAHDTSGTVTRRG